jgi:hypothetical protein
MRIKILAIFIFLVACQRGLTQVKFAALAGPQFTGARYTINEKKQSTSYKAGLMAGIGLKVPFENRLYFFPSVYYSLKGYKVDFNTPSYPPTQLAVNNNTTIHTIEVAPLFQVDLSPNLSHPFIRFGASVDFALGGKESFDTLNASGIRGNVRHKMLFAYTDYGRYTASGLLHFGYESSKGWMLYASYTHGIGSLNNADYGPHILHRIIGITGGYYFAEKQ